MLFALWVVDGARGYAGELVFQSGFEPASRVVSSGADADIVGKEQATGMSGDWVQDLDHHPEVGEFTLQYQGGDDSQRFARIVPEPGNPDNHVLHFWLREANVNGKKGRVQANLYGGRGWKEFYQSVRIYLPEDFSALRSFPDAISWLTIAEYWNNITWNPSVPHGFRITLGIGKAPGAGRALHFMVDAEDGRRLPDGRQVYTTLWSDVNHWVAVPIGRWFTAEYYYREGDDEHGRYQMSIQPEGGERVVVFDGARLTHNSADPAPDGVSDFNPMKLYTSRRLLEHMKSRGKTLQIYWDDFELWKNRRPGRGHWIDRFDQLSGDS
jgi:hypothetical protein